MLSSFPRIPWKLRRQQQPARHSPLTVEVLEERFLLSGSPPGPVGGGVPGTLAGGAGGPRGGAGGGVGQEAGNAGLAGRRPDGSDAASNYQPAPGGGNPGVYELTPAAGQGAKLPGFLPAL